MSGTLYVVGTPIGNLGDISPRALETLENCDFVAAEDTRVSLKLLNHFGIKKPMISYFEHNKFEKGPVIAARLLAGESCCIVTDAGMPAISDPGEDLVRLCHERGIKVEAVPGPCAFATALAVSGMPSRRFSFEGFLPADKNDRRRCIEKLAGDEHTLIFYEAPHKLIYTLKDMLEYFGDRRISLCRELTKIHEEVFRTTLAQAVEYYEANKPKGEFVLVIEGAKEDELCPAENIEEALEQVKALVEKGMRGADACREIAKATGFSKGELYGLLFK